MDKAALLDEIIQYTTPPRLEEGEFIVRDYIARCAEQGIKVSYKQAACRLSSLIEAGQLEKRKVLHQGKWTWAYRKLEVAT